MTDESDTIYCKSAHGNVYTKAEELVPGELVIYRNGNDVICAVAIIGGAVRGQWITSRIPPREEDE